MLVTLHPDNPQPRALKTITETLLNGGVIIYPTDTVYGLGCDIFQPKAIEKICRIKQVDPQKVQLSFICNDLSNLSKYTKSISTPLYRLLKHCLPGPYTFILPASKEVPKLLKTRRDTIGLRVPDNIIARTMIETLGHPILSASIPGDWGDELGDPEIIHEKFEKLVDLVVDGGPGGLTPSTILDCTSGEPVPTRQGLGEWPLE